MILLKRRWLGSLRCLGIVTLLAASYPPPPVSQCLSQSWPVVGVQNLLAGAISRSPVVCQAPASHSWFSVLSAPVCSPPYGLSPSAQTFDCWSSALRAPSPKAIKMQQLGARAKWLWKIARRLLISGVCWFVLFFPFAVAQEPKHPPLISYRVKWPGPVPSAPPGGWASEAAACDGPIIPHSAVNRTLHPPAATQPVPRRPAALSWPVMTRASLLR